MDSKPKAGKLAKAIVRLARSARQRAVKLRCEVREKRRAQPRQSPLAWSPDAAQ